MSDSNARQRAPLPTDAQSALESAMDKLLAASVCKTERLQADATVASDQQIQAAKLAAEQAANTTAHDAALHAIQLAQQALGLLPAETPPDAGSGSPAPPPQNFMRQSAGPGASPQVHEAADHLDRLARMSQTDSPQRSSVISVLSAIEAATPVVFTLIHTILAATAAGGPAALAAMRRRVQ